MASAKYLLDTHCLIWFQENNPKIPEHVMQIIQNTANEILLSQISLFEISIKQTIGKLPTFSVTVEDIYDQAIKDAFVFTTINNQYIYNYANVPLFDYHRDPFDRLLISTAAVEGAIILSADKKLSAYNSVVKVIW